MKKINLFLIVILGLVLLFGMSSEVVKANNVGVGFTAGMPAATSIEVSATPIDSKGTAVPTDDTWGTTTKSTSAISLDFETSTLTVNPDTGVYGSQYYYALEVGSVGGAWSGPVSVSYAAGTNDLALHATATVQLMTYVADDDPTSTDVEKVRLDNISDLSVAQLTGHWPRIYIGLANGDEPAALNVEPFTAASTPGTYTGTLTFTYTGS